jgi:hypothetical protein
MKKVNLKMHHFVLKENCFFHYILQLVQAKLMILFLILQFHHQLGVYIILISLLDYTQTLHLLN